MKKSLILLLAGLLLLTAACSDESSGTTGSSGTPDTTAPAVSDGTLSYSAITTTTITVSWNPASDSRTSQENLQYALWYSSSANISTIAQILTNGNGTPVLDWTTNTTSATATNLSSGTTYHFNVLVRDESNNIAVYTASSTATAAFVDSTDPTPGNSGTLSFTNVGSRFLTVTWTAGTDNVSAQADLQYLVILSSNNNVTTIADATNNGTVVMNWSADTTSTLVTNLSSVTTYYFNVLIRDEYGNISAYTSGSQGTLTDINKIASGTGGFSVTLVNQEKFGSGLAYLGDLDGDGVDDVAVGAYGNDDLDPSGGAVYILFMQANGQVKSHQKISPTTGGMSGEWTNTYSYIGYSLANAGDLNGDNIPDLAVGEYGHDNGGSGYGAVWILFLNTDGTVQSNSLISATTGGFTGTLNDYAHFGKSVSGIGDLNLDGVPDLAVGSSGFEADGNSKGAVWILFMNSNGTVLSNAQISSTNGGFSGTLDDLDYFGCSVCKIGDLDGDGIPELAAGAWADDDGGTSRGAVWILFMNRNGTVKSQQKISDTEGSFTGSLDNVDMFGGHLAGIGDFNSDGIPDIAVGANGDDDGYTGAGAVWILSLDTDGTVKFYTKISSGNGGFSGLLSDSYNFGVSITSMGDFDHDGIPDIMVGGTGDDTDDTDTGAVRLLFLNSDGTVK